MPPIVVGNPGTQGLDGAEAESIYLQRSRSPMGFLTPSAVDSTPNSQANPARGNNPAGLLPNRLLTELLSFPTLEGRMCNSIRRQKTLVRGKSSPVAYSGVVLGLLAVAFTGCQLIQVGSDVTPPAIVQYSFSNNDSASLDDAVPRLMKDTSEFQRSTFVDTLKTESPAPTRNDTILRDIELVSGMGDVEEQPKSRGLVSLANRDDQPSTSARGRKGGLLASINSFGSRDRSFTEQIQAARSLDQQGELAQAIQAYESLLQSGCESPLVYHRLAMLYDVTDQLIRSLRLYDRALELDPANPDLLCDFGFRWFVIENNQMAEKYYRRALEVDPAHARTHINYGLLLAQTGRSELAYRHFQRGGLDPTEASNNIAVISQTTDVQQACFESLVR